MVIKYGRYGKFLACPGFPECQNAKPLCFSKADIRNPLRYMLESVKIQDRFLLL